jgi:hypothetical protein
MYISLVVVCSSCAFIACLQFLRRTLELRHERLMQRPNEVSLDASLRLERIESIVETTALEVERIAEANRFMSKLLADGARPTPMLPRPERVITPH